MIVSSNIFRTHTVIIRINLLMFGTHPSEFRTKTVIHWTETVIHGTNPVIFVKQI